MSGQESSFAEIKNDLFDWLHRSVHPNERKLASLALLETAIARYIDDLGEADARSFILATFERLAALRPKNPRK
jgi:hypothetical protein